MVVGAGISGIAAAGYNLNKSCPSKSFTIYEGRSDLGGTWDLPRYSGIRSDSDMHTLGFRFKPWIHDKSLADGHSILEHINETWTPITIICTTKQNGRSGRMWAWSCCRSIHILPNTPFDFFSAGVALPNTNFWRAKVTMTQLDYCEACLPHHYCC